MLKLSKIVKRYVTGDQSVTALKGVNIEFGENEFVSVLGPSGCGKTTMLNIIGGLDRYDEGDLIIDGKSTKEFSDKDWDSYRNHSIGFVFQSYNLIPHQTVLSNVELALTLSGVSKSERRKRAIEVLKKVGLEDQLNKKPNQMSGGQMQRVAIARALVNNPRILLADEPTGALDSETSVQIMGLLKEIAEDKLVIMVTHNPELADEYSTRIIRLLDGEVQSDSATDSVENSVEEASGEIKEKKKPNKKRTEPKTSMSLKTAMSLSTNNLMTKKARTFLTSFAGSIGIIGIALILALSTGFQAYIDSVQEDALSSYPITIEAATINLSGLMGSMSGGGISADDITHDYDKVYTREIMADMMNTFTSEIEMNDLESFKEYIEENKLAESEYVNAIQYSYEMDLNIFKSDVSNGIVQVSPNAMFETMMNASGASSGAYSSMTSSYASAFDAWTELIDNEELLHSQYDVLAGRWPEKHDEVILILTKYNEITDVTLYALGLKSSDEMLDLMFPTGEEPEEPKKPVEQKSYTYEEIMDLSFSVVPPAEMYDYDETSKVWVDKSLDEEHLAKVIGEGLKLKIVGVVRPSEETVATATGGAIGYLSSLTSTVIEKNNRSEAVLAQKANPDINIFTGKPFDTEVAGNQTAGSAESANSAAATEPVTQPASEAVSAYKAPQAGTLAMANKSPEVGEIAVNGNMTEDEIYAYIDENMSGKERDDMKRMVELILKSYHTPEEKEELIGLLDYVMKNSAEMGGMPSQYADGTTAYNYLMSNIPSVRRRMISSIIMQISSGEQPTVDSSTQPSTSDSGTTKPNKPNKPDEKTTAEKTTNRDESTSEEPTTEAPTESVSEEVTEEIPEQIPETNQNQIGGGMYEIPDTYESNLIKLGAVNKNSPKTINIYPVDFESKDAVSDIIDEYNKKMTESGNEDKTISYTDYIGLLLSSVTKIVNTVSYVLIAFVAISLIVSSIMIGIITYISVLERTKEIGILRSIGASKRDISRVFNAETALIGFASGALGIIVTLLLTIPINMVIKHVTGISGVARLEPISAIILVVISMVLTLIAGLIPSSIAAKKDPVEALRTE